MNTVKEVLERDKYLNDIGCDDHEQFATLFNHEAYQNTYNFFEKNKVYTFHDAHVKNFSQKKQINDFSIFFKLDSILVYENGKEIGTINNSEFHIRSTESLRQINNKCVLSFLIDEEKKEIAFLCAKGIHTEVISIKYTDIKFVKGQENLYANNKRFRM